MHTHIHIGENSVKREKRIEQNKNERNRDDVMLGCPTVSLLGTTLLVSPCRQKVREWGCRVCDFYEHRFRFARLTAGR